VPLAIGSVFLVKPHVDSGRLRAIAVTSRKPDPLLPGAEPIASQGVADFEAYTWWGVYAPANMPPALAKRIYDELAKAINAPAVKEKLQGQGIDVSGAPGSELDGFVRKEITRWAKVIKDNNIKSGD
jgi:tripartite-type tricarboxylate transporter receptor subunit TctC